MTNSLFSLLQALRNIFRRPNQAKVERRRVDEDPPGLVHILGALALEREIDKQVRRATGHGPISGWLTNRKSDLVDGLEIAFLVDGEQVKITFEAAELAQFKVCPLPETRTKIAHVVAVHMPHYWRTKEFR